MGLFNNNNDIQEEQDDATKPIQTEETPADTEVAPEAADETEAPRKDVAFDCSTCKGEGLVWHEGLKRHELCPLCFGKGNVN